MPINQLNNGDSGLTARTIINELVTSVNSGNSLYKTYVAALAQEGTGQLQVQVLENTIDSGATWNRNSIGLYTLTFPTLGTFNGAKIWTSTGGNGFGDGSSYGTIFNLNSVEFYYYTLYPVLVSGDVQTNWTSNSIKLGVFDNISGNVDLSTALGVVVGPIKATLNIEIRLYN